jgi:hypothetical protein
MAALPAERLPELEYAIPINSRVYALNPELARKLDVTVLCDNGRPYRLKLAVEPQEHWEVYGLRCNAYANEGYIDSSKFPDGLEYDDFDWYAYHLYARDILTNELKGNVRLVEDSEIGLPLEKQVNIQFFRSEDKLLFEESRLISYPKRQPFINHGLLVMAQYLGRQLKATHFVGLSREEFEDYFRRIGFFRMNGAKVNRYDGKDSGHQPPGSFFANFMDVDEWQYPPEWGWTQFR